MATARRGSGHRTVSVAELVGRDGSSAPVRRAARRSASAAPMPASQLLRREAAVVTPAAQPGRHGASTRPGKSPVTLSVLVAGATALSLGLVATGGQLAVDGTAVDEDTPTNTRPGTGGGTMAATALAAQFLTDAPRASGTRSPSATGTSAAADDTPARVSGRSTPSSKYTPPVVPPPEHGQQPNPPSSSAPPSSSETPPPSSEEPPPPSSEEPPPSSEEPPPSSEEPPPSSEEPPPSSEEPPPSSEEPPQRGRR